MADACRQLGVPVVSGNVSLYNESQGTAIFPTPIVGGLGLLDDVQRHSGAGFPRPGLAVILLGAAGLSATAADLAGSEYLHAIHGMIRGRPEIDLALEQRVQDLCRRLISDGVALSAHDCSDGGFAVALAESCILGDTNVGGSGSVGFTATAEFAANIPARWDAALFGEASSRILVAVEPENVPTVLAAAQGVNVPACQAGETGGVRLRIGSLLDLGIDEGADAWYGGLDQASS